MSIVEIEAAISRLPAAEISELKSWLDSYHDQLAKDPVPEELDDRSFDALIAEAYASGEASPFTTDDIGAARRTVNDRILARDSAK